MALNLTRQQIDEVKDKANDNIEVVLSSLGMNPADLMSYGEEIRSSCPIHKGDNPTAFCYYHNTKRWLCYTNKCHEGNEDILGLVRLKLEINNNKPYSIFDAIQWLSAILNISHITEKISDEDLELLSLISKCKRSNSQPPISNDNSITIPVETLSKNFIPSQFFMDQGFTKETINQFYIGYCDNPQKPMYLRSYAPVLNDTGTHIIGVTGRTHFPSCEFCPWHHEPNKGCPHENPSIIKHSKWKHYGFKKNDVLYNIDIASHSIKKYKSVFIVEGPKDLWWLYQHKVFNVVSIFGLTISKYQIQQLINNQAITVNLLLDNDDNNRGQEASYKLKEKLEPYFTVRDCSKVLGSHNDIAEITTEDMIKTIVPQLLRR